MNERLKFKGRLAEKEQEIKQLKLRMAGDVTALRELLDPTEPLERLKTDIIAAQAIELADKNIRLNTLIKETEAIREVLGD